MNSVLERFVLSAPVTVTWEITAECNFSCRHCLSAEAGAEGGELDTGEALELVSALADWGVFQVNLGGGEPFLRRDVFDIIEAGSVRGMLMCASTNGSTITPGLATALGRLGDVAVQVSLEGASAETHEWVRDPGTFRVATEAAKLLVSGGVRTAFNVVVTRRNLADLDALLGVAESAGADLRLSRLRPSGRAKAGYQEMQLTAAEFDYLGRWLERHPEVRTGDSFFFLGASSGPGAVLNGCGAGRLTLSIDPVGDVYPCAFLMSETWRLGNVRAKDPAELWEEPLLEQVRSAPSSACLVCSNIRCRRDCPARSPRLRAEPVQTG